MTRRDEGFFASRDGTRLYWRLASPEGEPKGWIGLIHGYGDHSGRYLRPIDAFVAKGYGVLAFDYRGHGRADGARGDCFQWSDYLEDLSAFMARLLDVSRGKKAVLLAHSHGALMTTHAVASGLASRVVGIILSAPFYSLAFEPPRLKVLGARLIRRVLPGLKIANELKPEQLSRDTAWQEETSKDEFYLHSTTPRWFFECMAAQQRLSGLGPQMKTPLFMLTGSADPVAATPAAKAFFDTVGSADKTYKEYPEFRHEVLMEVGREAVWDDISSWISAHL